MAHIVNQGAGWHPDIWKHENYYYFWMTLLVIPPPAVGLVGHLCPMTHKRAIFKVLDLIEMFTAILVNPSL